MKLKRLNQKRANGELTKTDFTLRVIQHRIEKEVTPFIKLLLPYYLPFPKDSSRWLSHSGRCPLTKATERPHLSDHKTDGLFLAKIPFG